MSHVVLLGDSIFDNAAYVPGGEPVIEQLRGRLPKGWRGTLLAVDGSLAAHVVQQMKNLPEDATHLVLSTGGNNALVNADIVDQTDLNAAEGWMRACEVQDEFRQEYQAMLDTVMKVRLPTTLCTVYDTIPDLPRQALTALSIFNDVILREGFRRGLPIIDLRLICNEMRDYSDISSIEPSEVGGAKITRVITRVVTSHDFNQSESVVYR